MTGRRLEPQLERLGAGRGTDRGDEPLYRRIGARVAALADLACQANGAQVAERRDPLAQIIEIRRELARPANAPRTVSRRLKTLGDVFADCLWIAPRSPGNGADRQALTVKVQYHDELSKLDHPHRSRPNQFGRQDRVRQSLKGPGRCGIWGLRAPAPSGNNAS